MELLRMASSMRMESNQSDNDYGDKRRWENTYIYLPQIEGHEEDIVKKASSVLRI